MLGSTSDTARVMGTTWNLPPGHHLWLLVQYFPGEEYFPAEQEAIPASGSWTVNIVFPRPDPLRIVLADIGSNYAYNEVQFAAETQTSVDAAMFSQDLTILDSLPLTGR